MTAGRNCAHKNASEWGWLPIPGRRKCRKGRTLEPFPVRGRASLPGPARVRATRCPQTRHSVASQTSCLAASGAAPASAGRLGARHFSRKTLQFQTFHDSFLVGFQEPESLMILQQYYLGCLAHASYMIADEETRQAVVVDPQRDVAHYIQDAEAAGSAHRARHSHALSRRLRCRPRRAEQAHRCEDPRRRPSPGRVRVHSGPRWRRRGARARAPAVPRDPGAHARGHLHPRLRSGSIRRPAARRSHRGHDVHR